MGLFGKKREGGLMDEIRCDEQSYLIWKWRPVGAANYSHRENAVRWGSSLRVREGSVAVFLHATEDGTARDVVEGPYDGVLDSLNLPVIANVIGLAYDGGTPWQAEVYFINLAQIIQIKFGVPFFDVFDQRYPDFSVPVGVHGTLTFRIRDYNEFIALHRLDDFKLETFKEQINDAVLRYVKSAVINAPAKYSIPVVQLETHIEQINESAAQTVSQRLEKDFGVAVTGFDIASIVLDKTSVGYRQLMAVTKDITFDTVRAQSQVNIKNLQDAQRINAENTEETLCIQREESQYAQHLQTQSANLEAYRLGRQADIGQAGAESLGDLGAGGGLSLDGNGGLNPAGMMVGMAMGGALGQGMASMMNDAMGAVNQPAPQTQTPPPVPSVAYHVVIDGQSTGPYDLGTLATMAANGQLLPESYVWKPGMADWEKADSVQELIDCFGNNKGSGMPPIPPDAV